MKNLEILELSNEEIKSRVGEEKTILTKLKFAHAISKIENPMRINQTRKLIARLNTHLSARRLQQEVAKSE